MTVSARVVQVSELKGISPAESQRLGLELDDALVGVLSDLSDEQWETVTRCSPWTVKDMTAHVIGWGEALTSFKEMRSQVSRSLRRSKEFGNPTDAQNNIQVEDRKHLSATQILERFRAVAPRMGAARRRFGTALRYFPAYTSYLGGFINLGYLLNTIFLRDSLIHRLDICAAIGREPQLTEADRRVIADMLRDWSRRTGADVRVDDGTDVYVAGAGTTVITGPLHRLVDVLSGRADPASLSIEGDRTRVEAWLRAGVPV